MKTIEQEIEELTNQIRPIQDRIGQLKQQLIESRSKFKVGDVISWNKGTRKGRILEIRHWVCGEPMWLVRRITKSDGLGANTFVRQYNNPSLLNPS